MSNQKIVSEAALSAIASDIKTALSGKANSDDVYPKSQTYSRTEIDNALNLKADKSELYNVYPTDQENGSIAHFTDGADNIPVKSLVSEIVAVESGNGQPKSPTNPYTISGFDSGVVSVCGVNIFDEEMEVGTLNNSTGATETDVNKMRSVNFIPVKPNTTYSVFNSTGVNLYIYSYGVDKSFIAFDNTGMVTGSTFITDSNTHYIKFRTQNNPTYSNNISINYPSSDTQYHAYNGNTYTFAFGQTVYGGHFDNKGNLVVTHGIISDLGSIGWAGSDGQFNYSFNVIPKNWTRNSENWGKCSALKVESWVSIEQGTQSNNSIHGLSWNNTIFILRIYASDYSTADELKSALSGQSLIYELDNPITLAITSQDIPTLLGENNIFSNCGDVEVDYHADIGLYIDKKISSLAQG